MHNSDPPPPQMDDVSVLTYISYEFFFAVCASSTPVNKMHPYYQPYYTRYCLYRYKKSFQNAHKGQVHVGMETLAPFPGLPHFYLPFAFTIIHRNARTDDPVRCFGSWALPPYVHLAST